MSTKTQKMGAALKYSVLPGILPRLAELFGSGFSHMAYAMAHVYAAVRLLPANHPYLNYDNMGRYGVTHVIAEARRNLVPSWRNIDQIIIFGSIMLGLVLMLMQIGLFALSFFVQRSWADGGTAAAWGQRFIRRSDVQDDLAFVTLDRIFGIPGIFNSRVAGGSDGTFPTPFHLGLQELFSYYSIGIFGVAIIIILYYIVTIAAETATSGTPFGRRMNKGWAPIRLILAIGLLAPISHGMNIAQLSTLRTAKAGSNLASNAWVEFNKAVGEAETALGPHNSLIAIPNAPELGTMLEWIMVARTCKAMEKMIEDRDIDLYLVHVKPPINNTYSGDDAIPISGASFQQAIAISAQGMIYAMAGEKHEKYTQYPGNVRPICGTIGMKVVEVEQEGPNLIQSRYFETLQFEWQANDIGRYAEAIAKRFTPTVDRDLSSTLPSSERLQSIKAYNISIVKTRLNDARKKQIEESNWDEFGEKLGWVGAGMWYNRVAQYNGTFFHAVHNVPAPIAYAEIMEEVRARRAENEDQVQPRDRYRPFMASASGAPVELRHEIDMIKAQAYYFAQSLWFDVYVPSDQSPILDMINLIFGTSGLFDMRKNIDEGIHPLAALVGIGSGLIESTIVNLGVLVMGGALGGIGSLANSAVIATLGNALAGMSYQIAILGLSMGFILFYVLPFLPFVYFFFAFGGWLKAVFEAMVGLPLWALAHLRIDGEGMNGPGALDGFFLIFEIFIRPIVILIALISSVTIFSALVHTLNSVWDLVITNLTGHTPSITESPEATETVTTGLLEQARNTADYLFYTILYAVIVYMMGMSCFKLIDQIPATIMRWLGKNVKAMGTGSDLGDVGQSMMTNVFMTSNVMAGQIGGSASGFMGGLFGRNG